MAKIPKNMTRIIVEDKDGILSFAFHKDGMFRLEDSGEWIPPDSVKNWEEVGEAKKKLWSK